jgi:NAD+ synthase (glutamine-hydrolysing)
MVDGFVKCAAAGIKVQVADAAFNAQRIMDKAKECTDRGAKIIVFGELSVSASTCGDLFFQPRLIAACEEAVKEIAAFTKDLDAVIFVGVPFANR